MTNISFVMNTSKSGRNFIGSHFDRVKNYNVTSGGLSFNMPRFSCQQTPIRILPGVYNSQYIYDSNSIVIRDIGKKVTLEMGQDGRTPIIIDNIPSPSNLHSTLVSNLGQGYGIMDMWCKQEGCTEIVVPVELECITSILSSASEFERRTNPDWLNWNMWLLVDTRPIIPGHTQRNSGFHYDGLNLGGKYANTPLVSIYAWTNCLATTFYNKPIMFPKDVKPTDNVSVLAQRQCKDPSNLVFHPPESLIKFDGATLHSGAYSHTHISDRVFIRICFTAPGIWFDRLGNTINPYLKPFWKWRQVLDPSILFKNTTEFANPQEFKNLWDIACLGHHAFGMMYSGRQSHEFGLVKAIRFKGLNFFKQVIQLYKVELYNNHCHHQKEYFSPIEARYRLLELKYFY